MTGVSVCCDKCGVQLPDVLESKAEARKRAKSSGWTVRKIGKQDYFFCPEHPDAEPDQKVMKEVMQRYGYEVTRALNL